MANQPSDLRPGDDPRPNPPYGLWHNLRGANGQDAGVVSTPLRAALSPVGGSILSSFRGFLFHRVHFVLAAARELTAVSKECWKILTDLVETLLRARTLRNAIIEHRGLGDERD
jgi:hypothetical protein